MEQHVSLFPSHEFVDLSTEPNGSLKQQHNRVVCVLAERIFGLAEVERTPHAHQGREV
jgi:hypothetical protein